MKIAYICLLVSALMPFLWVGLAKGTIRYNNYAPRDQLAKLTGWRARANWAQLNAFEAFPFFAAAILAAIQAGVAAETVNLAAVVFVGARLLHGILYIANQAWPRTAVWFVGLGSCVYLVVQAINRMV